MYMGPDCIPNWVLNDQFINPRPTNSIDIKCIYPTITGPTAWKKADVIPIQKVKEVNDINSDLRPISLTSILGKICERFIADWLMKSIIDKIDRRQYGSLKKSSTTHARIIKFHSPYY